MILPNSPNWHSSRICDWSSGTRSLIAFGARNDILLLLVAKRNTEGEESICFEKEGATLTGHFGRVVAVSFHPNSALSHLLFSAAEDQFIRVWDTFSSSCIAKYEVKEEGILKALAVSLKRPDIVAAGNSKGTIIVWYWSMYRKESKSETNDIVVIKTPPLGAVIALSFCPSNGTRLAAGFANGTLAIVDTAQGVANRYFSVHSQSVQDIAWHRPVHTADANSSSFGDGILASVSKNGTVRIFDTSHELSELWSQVKVMCVSSSSTERGQRKENAQLWSSLAWSSPQLMFNGKGFPMIGYGLIVSSHHGELHHFTWNGFSDDSEINRRKFSNGHHRSIFGIVVEPNLREEKAVKISDFFLGQSDRKFVTISMDRQIILWNLNSMKPIIHSASLGGVPTCLCSTKLKLKDSKSRQNFVAVGAGDGMLRICSRDFSQCKMLWKGLHKKKITCIASHPRRSSQIAIGCADGHILINDIGRTTSDKWVTLASHHDSALVHLQWRLLDGIALNFDFDKEENKIKNLTEPSEPLLYSVAEDGTLLESDPLFPEVTSVQFDVRVQLEKKCNCFKWNIGHKAYLAIGSMDKKFYLFETGHSRGEALQNLAMLDFDDVPRALAWSFDRERIAVAVQCKVHILAISTLSSIDIQLVGHNREVLDLCWRPMLNSSRNLLLTTSADATVQLWDSSTGEPLINIRDGHNSAVLCAMWMNPGTFVTTSADHTVRRWNIDALFPPLFKTPPVKKKRKRKKK
eukprot:g2544.t1